MSVVSILRVDGDLNLVLSKRISNDLLPGAMITSRGVEHHHNRWGGPESWEERYPHHLSGTCKLQTEIRNECVKRCRFTSQRVY